MSNNIENKIMFLLLLIFIKSSVFNTFIIHVLSYNSKFLIVHFILSWKVYFKKHGQKSLKKENIMNMIDKLLFSIYNVTIPPKEGV